MLDHARRNRKPCVSRTAGILEARAETRSLGIPSQRHWKGWLYSSISLVIGCGVLHAQYRLFQALYIRGESYEDTAQRQSAVMWLLVKHNTAVITAH